MNSKEVIHRLPTIIMSAGILAAVTILVCYFMSTSLGHIPEKIIFPFISLTGYKMPEYFIYSIGFTITGVLFLFCSYHIHYSLLPVTKMFSAGQVQVLFSILTIGVVCFMIHGVIPLQSDIGATHTLTVWSKIHQRCAGIFFLLVIIHTIYLRVISNRKQDLLKKYFNESGMKLRKYALLICLVTFVLAMGIHPTTMIFFSGDIRSLLL